MTWAVRDRVKNHAKSMYICGLKAKTCDICKYTVQNYIRFIPDNVNRG